jgi:hypothetical protein
LSRRSAGAINDAEEPHASDDPASSFDWWPRKGTAEWVELTFARPSTVSEVQVYWFDDTGDGEVRAPAAWRVSYRDGASWRPVETTDVAGVERDRYNRVTFRPVMTSGVRVDIQARDGFSVGVQEIKVK